MGNHASFDQQNTLEVAGDSSMTSVHTDRIPSKSSPQIVDEQIKACSNNSGMNDEVLSDKEDTEIAAGSLQTKSNDNDEHRASLTTRNHRGGAEHDGDDEDKSQDESEHEHESEGEIEYVKDGYGSDGEEENRGKGSDIAESAKMAVDTKFMGLLLAASSRNGLSSSRGTSLSSSTRGSLSPSPPPRMPSQSQPFPLPSYEPMTPLDPTINFCATPPHWTDLESSPESDLPSVSEMLAKMRPPASQPVNSAFQNCQVQDSVHHPATPSQSDIEELRRPPISPRDAWLLSPPPKRPRPLASKLPLQIPIKVSTGSSTPSPPTALDNETVGGKEDNEKGKRKASDEAIRDPKVDVSTENSGEVRPAKRSRLERVGPRKHDQFWILDGNTVLEVGGVLFKLHRSRLVDQSNFFAGLLDGQDVYMDYNFIIETDENGVVVYHISDTTPKDLEALLQLDKDPMAYYFTPPPFPVLAAILRAATALGFDTYRSFAVKLLENAWPSSLTDLSTEKKPNAVEVVALAQTCGVESVLKRAFYEMVRVSGYGLGDGELYSSDGAGSKEISRADERRLERMREHLISAWSQVAVRVDRSFICPDPSQGYCITERCCDGSGGPNDTDCYCPSMSMKRDAWERLVHDSGLYDEYQFDPLCGLQALIDIKWDEVEGWCESCVRARREAWTRMRQRTWERVGVWMGLDN